MIQGSSFTHESTGHYQIDLKSEEDMKTTKLATFFNRITTGNSVSQDFTGTEQLVNKTLKSVRPMQSMRRKSLKPTNSTLLSQGVNRRVFQVKDSDR